MATNHIERRRVLGGALAAGAVGAGLTGCGTTAATVESTGTASSTPATVLVAATEPGTATVPAATAPTTTALELPVGDFGEPVDVGPLEAVLADIDAAVKLYVPNARAWLVRYPAEHVEAAKLAYDEALHEALDLGILALYQKCAHLGCRVPECAQSGQFECPCHGSIYSGFGERLDGPAPHGLDLFPVRLAAGHVVIDTRIILQGVPRGTDVTGWQPDGPQCVNGP